jgi:hypothetical protein
VFRWLEEEQRRKKTDVKGMRDLMKKNSFVGGWKTNREGTDVKVSKRFYEKDQVCVCGWKTNREGTDVEGNEKGYETEHVCEVGRGTEKKQM